jgi:hypothetical protein
MDKVQKHNSFKSIILLPGIEIVWLEGNNRLLNND